MLTVSLAVFAAASCVIAGLTQWPRDVPWETVPLFAVLLTLGAFPILRLRYGDAAEILDLLEAVLAPAIFVLPGPVVVPLVAVSVGVANLLIRNPGVKLRFNVAQWAAAAGAGSLTFNAIRSGQDLDLRNVAALALAVLVSSILNELAVAYVLRLTSGAPARHALAGVTPLAVWLVGSSVNTGFGLLFVASYLWTPAALALYLAPLFVLQRAYRSQVGAIVERGGLSALHRATQAVSSVEDQPDATAAILSEVLDAFNAGTADLVLATREFLTIHRVASEERSFSIHVEQPGDPTLAGALLRLGRSVYVTPDHPELGALLRNEGWRDCLAAPLLDEGRTIGVLCAYDSTGVEGFDQSRLAVLEALAAEVAGIVLKSALRDALREERRMLSQIVDYASDGGFAVGRDGKILMWNPGLERSTGLSAEIAVGMTLPWELDPRDALGRPVPLERWADEPGLPSDFEILTREGERVWLSCAYTRLPDAHDRPSMLIVLARDVTSSRRIERFKENFAGTVAHELRRPLTPIKGWAVTLLKQGDRLTPAERSDIAARIVRQSTRLESLMENLLDVSAIEHGVAAKRESDVEVRTVVRRLVSEFREAYPERLLLLELPRERCLAAGVEIWVEQIVSNLLANAVKYSPVDTPIIVRATQESSRVVVAVIDRGPGIPIEAQSRIFESYKRLDEPASKRQMGVGLGLYIARQLARAIGAVLTVQSAPGAGATFLLSLRRAVGGSDSPTGATSEAGGSAVGRRLSAL